ncbi:MAG: response regulator [Proteobacteria bacterium]|nr:response regulator [Pseudomonadota bacterium]
MASGKNVIVIQQTAEMLEVLYALKYKTMEAKDCIEGIRQTIRYSPDLVVVEIDTPSLNGLSMAKILKILQIKVPIVLTSFVEKHRKPAEAMDNVIGFLINPTAHSEKDKLTIRAEFESIKGELSQLDITKPEHIYSFRQHEWANLIGISGRKKVLIVEDDVSFKLLTLKKIDGADKYDLFSAQDGLEGVFKALLVEPDLILTDIMMPILDGMAMSQIFFILNKPFPIVFFTAKDDEESKRKAEKAIGVLGYMHKSAIKDTALFLEKIERYLTEAESLKLSREKIYQKGETEPLKKMGDDTPAF